MIFKRSISKIKARAETRGYRKARKFFLAELENQRKDFTEKMTEQKNTLEKEKEKAIKRTENKLCLEINRLKYKNTDLQDRIRKAQKAFLLYKDYIPDLLNAAEMVKSVKFAEQQAASREHKISEHAAFKVEHVHRRMIKLEPKIKELLGLL